MYEKSEGVAELSRLERCVVLVRKLRFKGNCMRVVGPVFDPAILYLHIHIDSVFNSNFPSQKFRRESRSCFANICQHPSVTTSFIDQTMKMMIQNPIK